MRPDRPSLTASIVSFARGAATRDEHSPCFDPIAAGLVPPPFTHVLKALDASGQARRWLEPAVRLFLGGLVGHIELRTALIDEAVRHAVEGGVRQIVVLGAGLDARAWRMQELSDCTVIEVDHPATQAWKRERVEGRRPCAREVHFAAVDFERTSLEDGLSGSPHRRDERTFWIWEGVTPYLNHSAIEATLALVSKRSSAGSVLAVTYATPEVIAATALRGFAYPMLKLIAEPLHGIIEPERFHALLGDAGFDVRSDELPAHSAERFGLSRRRGWASPAEHVVIAELTGTG